ncbi:MAG: hypothetical protein LQ347_000826 [Umbilicaria vellea]|nr:MAG: hypothetical protein LQ347_000826 [Umbilicaria vellea]
MDRDAFVAPARTSLMTTWSPPDTPRTSYSEDRDAGKPYIVQEYAESDDGSIAKMRGPSKREKLRGLTRKTKAKTKKLLHIHGDASADRELDGEAYGVLDNIEADPAFNPGKLVKEKPFTVRGAAEKTTSKLHSIASTVAHPTKNLRDKAIRSTADQLAKAERPFLSQNANRELLEAHQDLRRVQNPRSLGHGIPEKERKILEEISKRKIEDIEKHRDSLAVAYTTTRHVHRVRVIPKEHMQFPEKEAFVERDGNGNIVGHLWLRWLGNVRGPDLAVVKAHAD